jgi:folate-binding protein YgfZ
MGVIDEASARGEDLSVLENGAGWLPVAGENLVRVSGKDHREALQRVLSQDVLRLRPGKGGLALLLAPKGQFRAIMAVFVDGEQSYLLAPPGRGGELTKGLATYLLLSRCKAEPVAAAGVIAVLGARWREAVAAAGGTAPSENGWLATPGVLWFGKTMRGIPGAVAVAQDPEGLAALRGALEATGTPPVSEGAVELARMCVGWPAWGAELTETVLPPEVGIEEESVSYSKGCYVGQETLARMRTYGHPTRGLVGLRQFAGSSERPALPVPLAAVGEEKARASLTSWGLHPKHGGVGLALVRHDLMQPGTRLVGDGREFEVTRLPLW